jgi:hypothetical protein
VPNSTAKARGPDHNAPGCGPPTHAVDVLNTDAKSVMSDKGVQILDLYSIGHVQWRQI